MMNTIFFDSHAHFDDDRFDGDRDELISSLPSLGIGFVTNIGADIDSSRASVALAEKYPHIYATVGVHPHDAKDMTEETLKELACLTEHDKVVAIGEIGLDYYYDNSPRNTQQYWFKRQMELAKALDLPVVIHSRDATEDTIKICRDNPVPAGVIHCFSGSCETAKIYLDMGYYISFAGPVTFKNASSLSEVAKIVPEDRLLIETDSPYLAPVPHRGERNWSLYVRDVAEKIASLRGTTAQHIAEITTRNAKALYRI